jgi:purine-binding chemotaxis protein CheW
MEKREPSAPSREREATACPAEHSELFLTAPASASLEEQRRQRILKERARKLAAGSGESATDADARQVVVFTLGRERYGLELDAIREVCPLQELLLLPGTPDFVLGIINVRGQIISIVNLKKFFDLPEKGLTDLNRVIILKHGGMEFGILADSIEGVQRLSFTGLQTTLPTLTGIRAEYLTGVTAERIVILDAHNILHDPKMIVHEKVVDGSY